MPKDTKQKEDQQAEVSQEKNFELTKEQEYLSGWKRALADYENLKKQNQREKEEYAKFANLNLIIGLIPVYEHLVLSFDHLPADLKDNSWVKGIEHIKKQFLEVLQFNGVEEVEPKVGDEFNPELHEAVSNKVENEVNEFDSDKNLEKKATEKIKKVLSHGFKLQGRIFKPAKVVAD